MQNSVSRFVSRCWCQNIPKFGYIYSYRFRALQSKIPPVLDGKGGVARAGIEPATQGFSVPCSTD